MPNPFGSIHSMRSGIKDFPDHHDAELALRCYELRRDPVMRESRAKINQFLPRTAEEALAIVKSDHPLNAAFRQTSSYWEMVYAMAKHGIVHPDFLLESASEGLLLYARVEGFLADFRKGWNPGAFTNAEWIANNCDAGKRLLERFRARVAKLKEATPA